MTGSREIGPELLGDEKLMETKTLFEFLCAMALVASAPGAQLDCSGCEFDPGPDPPIAPIALTGTESSVFGGTSTLDFGTLTFVPLTPPRPAALISTFFRRVGCTSCLNHGQQLGEKPGGASDE